MFAFPIGLIYFQFSVGDVPVLTIVSLSIKNPSAMTIANTVFWLNPRIPIDILNKTLQIDNQIIEELIIQ